jgi:hypothetical protein
MIGIHFHNKFCDRQQTLADKAERAGQQINKLLTYINLNLIMSKKMLYIYIYNKFFY